MRAQRLAGQGAVSAIGRGRPARISFSCRLAILFWLCLPAVPATAWTNVGPGGGGWIQTLSWSPGRPQVLYVGGDVSGVSVSNDFGTSFSAMNEGLRDYFVQSIAVSSRDPGHILLGTLGGVYRSLDGGASWQLERAGFPEPSRSSYSAPVSVVRFSPQSSSTAFAGIGVPRWKKQGQGAVYRTMNDGRSWQRLNLPSSQALVTDMAVSEVDPGTLLVATDEGVFRSVDFGDSWTAVGRNEGLTRVEAIAVADDEQRLVYAVSRPSWRDQDRSRESPSEWDGGVFRSRDFGLTWERTSGLGLGRTIGARASLERETSSYKAIAVDPRDPTHLLLGDDSWITGGVYESRDAGATWGRRLGNRLVDRPPVVSDSYGWISEWAPNVTALAFDREDPSRVAAGTSSQLFLSNDGGETWANAYSERMGDGSLRSRGMETTVVNDLSVANDASSTLFVCYADIGLFASYDLGKSFRKTTQAASGLTDCYSVAVSQLQPETVFASVELNGVTAPGLARSHDSGRTWEIVSIGDTHGHSSKSKSRIAVEDDPRAPETRKIWAAIPGAGVWSSTDDGTSWTDSSGDLPSGIRKGVSVIAAVNDSLSHVIAGVGEDTEGKRGLYVRSRGREEWALIDCTSHIGEVRSVRPDPSSPGSVFVAARSSYSHALKKALPGGLYRVDLSRATCSEIMEASFFNDVAFVGALNQVWAGSIQHPYFDQAAGDGILAFQLGTGPATYKPVAPPPGLGSRNVNAIVVSPDSKVVFVGTNGNGLFRWQAE